jgi:hypothetical protein
MEILDFAEFLKKRVFPLKQPQAEERQAPDTVASAWPEGFLESVMGGWQGEPLVREYEGDYEQRDALE